jgi:hypothetical protein
MVYQLLFTFNQILFMVYQCSWLSRIVSNDEVKKSTNIFKYSLKKIDENLGHISIITEADENLGHISIIRG